MANFIAMVYATLKADGVDTKGMSTDQAVAEFNKRHGSDGSGKKTESTPAEKERAKDVGGFIDKKSIEHDLPRMKTQHIKESIEYYEGIKDKHSGESRKQIDEVLDAYKKELQKREPKKEYERSGKGIKEELRDKGIDTKNISVKQHGGSYYVTIKDPTIDKDEVEKIVEHHESYERDYATGEILSGGNTFVFTNYDYGVFDEVSKPYKPKANEYIKKLQNIPDQNGITVKDGVYIMKDGNSYDFVVQNDKQWTRRRFYSEDELAKKLYQVDKFGKMV